MQRAESHPIYAQPATVYLETGTTKFEAMQRALDHSAFFNNLEAAFLKSNKDRKDFMISIKPNLMTASIREDPSPVYTDPELVEFLIDKIYEQGFRNIALVESRNVYDYSYQGRSVKMVADMVGYSARNYRIEDLTEQKVAFNYGGVLDHHVVGKAWLESDYRISFAKNKTHWQCFYTGCLKNVYGCLPEWDKMKHYHGKGREFYECCVLIADALPVHFGFLDAWVSGDGFSGHVRDADPNHTKTIFACENIFALDWAMGKKMGVDPTLNCVISEAVKKWGLIEVKYCGDMGTWENWLNIRPFVVRMLDFLEEFYHISRFFSRSFATVQDKRFPPVSRAQSLFKVFQLFMNLIERLFLKRL